MRRSITLFFVVNIVVILVTGGRTFAVILIALIVILYNYLVKRLTKKWLLVGCIGAFVLCKYYRMWQMFVLKVQKCKFGIHETRK